MKTHDQELLDESIAWISEHEDANTDDVPLRFLDAWLSVDEENAETCYGLLLEIFLFGFISNELRRHASNSTGDIFISDDKISACFERWRLKLAAAKVSRSSEFKVRRMPLFSFSEDEQFLCSVRNAEHCN